LYLFNLIDMLHQQVYNLLASFSAFLDFGKPKAAINTYRRSINLLVTWLQRWQLFGKRDLALPQVGLFGLVPAGAPKQEIVDLLMLQARPLPRLGISHMLRNRHGQSRWRIGCIKKRLVKSGQKGDGDRVCNIMIMMQNV
jgi:hypothetical protein